MSDSEYITLCEVKEVKATKELSGDMVIRLILITEDVNMLDIGKFAPDTLFELTLKPSDKYGT